MVQAGNQNKIVGERIQKIIDRFGLTQKEFGIRIGYGGDNPDRAINNIVHGRRPLPANKIQRINDEFQLNPDYLLLRSDDMTIRDKKESLVLGMHKEGIMWSRFLEIVADSAGYVFEPDESYKLTDFGAVKSLDACTLKNEAGKTISFSLEEINDYLGDIQDYAEMRLKKAIKSKSREG